MVGKSIGAGACANMKRGNTLYEITDDTFMISLLSVGKDPEEGYDWLYIVMLDIVGYPSIFFIFNVNASTNFLLTRR